MPVVEVKMWEGRDKEVKRALIRNVSKAVADTLKVELSHVNVIITDVPKDNWGLRGEQASQIPKHHQ